MLSFCARVSVSGKREDSQKHQAADTHVMEQPFACGCESHMQTYRDSSLSEEIVNVHQPTISSCGVKNTQHDIFISVTFLCTKCLFETHMRVLMLYRL